MTLRWFAPAALLALTILASASGASSSNAGGDEVFNVDSEQDLPDVDLDDNVCRTAQDTCTLRAAVMQANWNEGPETINLPAGTYTLTIPTNVQGDPAASGDLFVDTVLTIAGDGPAIGAAGAGGATIIDGGDQFRIFDVGIGSSLSLSGMTLRNGHPGDAGFFGGAIRSGFGDEAGATLELDNVVVEDSTADTGGAVSANGILEVTDSTFRDNTALSGEGGGIFYVGTDSSHHLNLLNSEVSGNEAGLYGGVAVHGTATIAGSTVANNIAVGGGGGIGAFGDVTIDITTISGNEVTTETAFSGHGGGVYSANSTLTITNSTISNNTAAGRGGGLLVTEQLEDSMNTTIDRTTIDGNIAGSGGGGIRMAAVGPGGGGHMTITDSTISNNTAAAGGGIYNVGIDHTSVLNVVNSTISGNTALDDGGGARTVGPDAETTIHFSTITNNRADGNNDGDGDGGGLFAEPEAASLLKSSILYGNTDPNSAPDCSGQITVTGANVIGDTTGCSLSGPAVGDVISGDPLLGPLSDNSGPAMTHALGEGSPAIDADILPAGNCPEADQRGITRPQGPACDLGAYELVQGFLWSDNDCSGSVDPFDALRLLTFEELTGVSGAGCPPLGGTRIINGVQYLWGEADCFGLITPQDALTILAWYAGVAYEQADQCPQIEEIVQFE